jgi:hypothetical protein
MMTVTIVMMHDAIMVHDVIVADNTVVVNLAIMVNNTVVVDDTIMVNDAVRNPTPIHIGQIAGMRIPDSALSKSKGGRQASQT